MSSHTLFILLTLVSFTTIIPSSESASLRDYVNSAAHYVGLDSLVSETTPEQAGQVPRCCDQQQPPIEKKEQVPPCVQVKQDEVTPSPTPAPCMKIAPVEPTPIPCLNPCPKIAPVVEPTPVPCPIPCPIDYESANAKSHGKMWEVALKGKALASTLTHALASPVTFTNDKIAEGAALLPGLMAAQGRIMGSAISAPVQFATSASSLFAKGVHGVMVGVPIAIGTAATAGVAGLVERMKDVNRQQAACDCAAGVPGTCPCATPGLVAAGSKQEEAFSIGEPVTDSPVTEQVTESVGGSFGSNQESVTDSQFRTETTTTGPLDAAVTEPAGDVLQALQSDQDVLIAM